jgi:hypothetical protein
MFRKFDYSAESSQLVLVRSPRFFSIYEMEFVLHNPIQIAVAKIRAVHQYLSTKSSVRKEPSEL